MGIQSELLKVQSLGLLEGLLSDKTTKSNIIWGTDAYREKGKAYERDQEMSTSLITGSNAGVIKNRAVKALEHQSERTKQHAEVFTPFWICRMMNDHADDGWFYKNDPHPFQSGLPIRFLKKKKWQNYVDARRLEITCGEAPYLVSRYDASTGESIPIKARMGILDRKLRVVNENAADESEWLKWTKRAFEATYGYEFQGDNLLIARLNLLMTFEEYLQARWNRKPSMKEYRTIANIICWNIWQMDGLTGRIPYCKAEEENHQIDFFDLLGFSTKTVTLNAQPACRIYDWRRDNSREFNHINEGGRKMKFDFIIGNPPYQDESTRDNGYAAPIYNYFLDNSYKIGNCVIMIHPARFLFNAGSTPKAWNQKMLNDPHLKVLHYEKDSSNVFSNTDIKGGIAISYRDKSSTFGAIETFTAYEELNAILARIRNSPFEPVSSIAYKTPKFRFDTLLHDFPECSELLNERRLATNVLEILDEKVFFESTDEPIEQLVRIYGRVHGARVYRWAKQKYIDLPENWNRYKLFLPKVMGSGHFGEAYPDIVVGSINEINTHTFMSIGCFSTEYEACSLLKYIKTKFARVLLGILKITQHNSNECWKYVPLQDFTSASDIDWTGSIADIDRQLYAKYALDEKEIAFIESHVKEMA